MTLKLKDAQRIIEGALKKATELRQPMNIAVVDRGGQLIAHVRMDKAWIGSVDIAIKKAWTARAFNIETKDLGKHAQPGGQFYGIQETNAGKVIIFAGGMPLFDPTGDGEPIGAIGVSGGSGEQDQAVAEAGVAAMAS